MFNTQLIDYLQGQLCSSNGYKKESAAKHCRNNDDCKFSCRTHACLFDILYSNSFTKP